MRTKPSKALLTLNLPPAAAGLGIGVMGGSFNPPHAGHRTVAETALRRLRLDRLWWVVSPGNPLKPSSDLEGLDARLAAVRALARDPRMSASGLEAALGTRYTVDTLALLRRRFPATRFVWVMGADSLATMHLWRDWRAIARLVPIAVVDRPGWHFRALSSPAARALARYRVGEAEAASLQHRAAPAWTFLTARLSPASSSAIREAKLGKGGIAAVKPS